MISETTSRRTRHATEMVFLRQFAASRGQTSFESLRKNLWAGTENRSPLLTPTNSIEFVVPVANSVDERMSASPHCYLTADTQPAHKEQSDLHPTRRG